MKSLREEIQSALQEFTAEHPSLRGDFEPAGSTQLVELMRAARSGSLPGKELARRIDHTLLKPDATAAEIERLCMEARNHAFASVCVNTGRLPEAVARLEKSASLPIAVVGFPLGAMETEAKSAETRRAVALGAKEIDMVISVGLLKDGAVEAVESDIAAVVKAAGKIPVKVILETCLLDREQKIAACVAAKRAGAKFVKTSTGFAASGATEEDVRLMRAVVGPDFGVKASGGIRTRADALRMIAAGADRIGASASVAMVTDSGVSSQSGGY